MLTCSALKMHQHAQMTRTGKGPDFSPAKLKLPNAAVNKFACWSTNPDDYSTMTSANIQGGLCPPSYWAHKAKQNSERADYTKQNGNPLTGVYAAQHIKRIHLWQELWRAVECYEYLNMER
jgi:hypothetical protein